MKNGPGKTPFRVVFLLQDLFFGGTQRHTLELARRLDPARFQTEIWLLMAGDDFVPLARSWNLSLSWLGWLPTWAVCQSWWNMAKPAGWLPPKMWQGWQML